MKAPFRVVIASVVLSMAGCAALRPDEPDKVLIDHGAAKAGVLSLERTGVLFGSIGFAPPNEVVSAMSFHMRSLDGKGHRFEVFATNRKNHAQWRAPDVDSESQRIWVFSGRVPAGQYEITHAAVSGADAREINWIHFKPTIPVTVTTDGAAYLGRWQLTPEAVADELGEELRVPGTPLVLRDTPEEDQVILVRQRGESPVGRKPIDDVLRNLIQMQMQQGPRI